MCPMYPQYCAVVFYYSTVEKEANPLTSSPECLSDDQDYSEKVNFLVIGTHLL